MIALEADSGGRGRKTITKEAKDDGGVQVGRLIRVCGTSPAPPGWSIGGLKKSWVDI
jgi:hypothetical protein